MVMVVVEWQYDITCRIETETEVIDSEEQEQVYVDLLVPTK